MSDSGTDTWGPTADRIFEGRFDKALAEMNLDLSPTAKQHCKNLYEMLAEANRAVNLVADASPEVVATRHMADSLLLLTTPALDEMEIRHAVDVGSGGGFPGLVLAIARPDIQWLLIESTGKKARFLEDVIFSLGLDNCSLSCSRAEQLGHNAVKREGCDLAVARAVAHCAVLCELCLPFVRVGGRMVLYKGPEGETEAAEAKVAAETCGGTLRTVHRAVLPLEAHARTFPVWVKTSPTPGRYPRREGKPQKEPLM